MPRHLAPFLILLAVAGGQSATLFDYGAGWNYLIGTGEASSPDKTSWRRASFNDSTWAHGQTPIGYSTSPNSPVENAIVTSLPASQVGNYRSVFFRRPFVLSNPLAVRELTLTVTVDDGCVAWVNGTLIGSHNVPGTELAFNAQASSAIEPTTVSLTLTNNLQQALLTGTNILAVQVVNANLTSSDLIFDAALSSDGDEVAPIVLQVTPPAGERVKELTSLEVVFSENVTGVDAADLLINGKPTAELTQVSPRDYVFSFAQPSDGTVRVAWANSHGIKDLAANPFNGDPWSYTLDSSPLLEPVLISEFMADNQNGIRDDDGNRSDWIELYNSGEEPVELAGWFLTDSTNALTKWRFPSCRLDPNTYLLVWASGKNRTNPPAPLHTNFKLEKSGGYLALVSPSTNLVSSFGTGYPPQQADISYGRDLADPVLTGFFPAPTPGQPNSTNGPGFAVEPLFSREQGVYTNASIAVALSAAAGEIRYTLDGSIPATNSMLYTSAITITTTSTLKARVFQAGLLPSPIGAKTYIMLDGTVARFTSNLPLMIVSTSGRGIVDHPAPGTQRTFASVIAVDTFRGRSSPLGDPDYFGQAGISIRGQSSAGFPKKPYRLELQNAYRQDRSAGLFGLPSESDWVLYNPYTDKPFLQNFLAQELFEKMGHYAVRTRFVELFVNTASGKVTYPRDYVGVYLLMEKIKVDKNRVDLERLTPYDTAEPEISGGYMFKKDKDTSGDLNFTTLGGAGFGAQTLKIHEPKPREITTAQLNWIRNYLRQMEAALYATDWKTRTGTNHYSHYLDVDSFVDQHWIVEFAKQIDGYRLSNYMQKDRNGKVKMEPIWDWNLSFGNADYLEGYNPSGWYWSLVDANGHIWLRRLMCGTTAASGTTGDPDFRQKITDRWSVLRTNVFAASNVLARVDEMGAYLSEAAARDFAKWPRLGTYVWPNPSLYVTPTTYSGIIAAMKNWIQGRYTWIDNQFVRQPTLSLAGGRIPAGFTLALSAPAGTVYYTLNGTDPRLPGGNVSPAATAYRGPIVLNSNARVFARTMLGYDWSGPSIGTFYIKAPSLAVTELMYHPAAPPTGSLSETDDFEFIEFKNTGSAPLNLQGFMLSGGVRFIFPAHTLAAGQRVVVVKNRLAFQSRYGTAPSIAGEYTGSLGNAGDRILLTGPMGEPVLDFSYTDSWHPVTDGTGFSLILTDETLPATLLNSAANWRPSAEQNGSPGAMDPAPPPFHAVVVSEILSNPGSSGLDWIELQNLSATAVDIGGWFLSDDRKFPMKYRVPQPTAIPAGGFVAFSSAQFNGNNPAALQPFGLSAQGEEVYVFSGNSSTNLTGYMHGFEFGAQDPDVSFGRNLDSTGRELLVAQAAQSIGRSNSGPSIPPVVISEIHYHPPEVNTNNAWWNNTEDEYVELFNRTAFPAWLHDPIAPTNTWRLTGEASFLFPANTAIPARGYLLVVNFDPANPSQLAAFRSKFAVPAEVIILGPFSGNLNNRGGNLSLHRPALPGGAQAPLVLAEDVDFSGDLPWPPAADGLGFALNRLDHDKFGNDPANWGARVPSPGKPAAAQGNPVSILQHPVSQLAVVGQTITLNVMAAGAPGLLYQWRFNGQMLAGATNSTLILTNLQVAKSGHYDVVVRSTNSFASSSAAHLLVQPDADGDGIPDAWEFQHALNPYDPKDAPADPDADDLSNLAEYIADTDPRDAGSALTVANSAPAGVCTISFRAAAHRNYTVLYSDSLNPIAWKTLALVPSQPSEHTATVTDPAPSSNRYYRLAAHLAPH